MGNKRLWQWIAGRFFVLAKREFQCVFRIIDVISHAEWLLYNSSSCWNERRSLLRQVCIIKPKTNSTVNNFDAVSSDKMYHDRFKTNKVRWFTTTPGTMLKKRWPNLFTGTWLWSFFSRIKWCHTAECPISIVPRGFIITRLLSIPTN